MSSACRRYQSDMAELSDQVRLLYREHSNSTASWQQKCSSAEKQVGSWLGAVWRMARERVVHTALQQAALAVLHSWRVKRMLSVLGVLFGVLFSCLLALPQLKKAQAEAADATTQLAAVEQALKTLEGGDMDAIKRQYVDAVRKMAVTQVRRLLRQGVLHRGASSRHLPAVAGWLLPLGDPGTHRHLPRA